MRVTRLLATAAIGGLLAGPAAAVTVAVDDDFKVTRVVTITSDTDLSQPIFIVGQVSDVVVVEDSPLLGEAVVTADNRDFGTVVQVQEYPDGTTRAIVDIAPGAGIEAEAAYFDLSDDVLGENYDGSIQLNMPASQLQQTLNNREDTDTSPNLNIPSTTGSAGETGVATEAETSDEADAGDTAEGDGDAAADAETDAATEDAGGEAGGAADAGTGEPADEDADATDDGTGTDGSATDGSGGDADTGSEDGEAGSDSGSEDSGGGDGGSDEPSGG